MFPIRTALFVPGHRTSWVKRAVASGADAIVLDLEDSVPPDIKSEAREAVAATIDELHSNQSSVVVLVRPNPLDSSESGYDLEAAVRPGLAGLFIPKVRTAKDIWQWEALAAWFERRNGTTGLEFVVPAETVEAIVNANEIAGASPRVGAMVGPTSEHADIARAVGFRQTREGAETLYLRSRVLLACRLHGIHPLTALWEDLADLEGLEYFATKSLELGFRGQVVIHPDHVSVVNRVFTPSDDEVRYYEEIVAAVESGQAEGKGAIRFRGQHLDLAHAEKAREWLAAARLLRERDRSITPEVG